MKAARSGRRPSAARPTTAQANRAPGALPIAMSLVLAGYGVWHPCRAQAQQKMRPLPCMALARGRQNGLAEIPRIWRTPEAVCEGGRPSEARRAGAGCPQQSAETSGRSGARCGATGPWNDARLAPSGAWSALCHRAVEDVGAGDETRLLERLSGRDVRGATAGAGDAVQLVGRSFQLLH